MQRFYIYVNSLNTGNNPDMDRVTWDLQMRKLLKVIQIECDEVRI